MSFARPEVLLALVLPLWLLGWVWRRAGGRLVLPFDHAGKPRGRWLWALVSLAESLPPALLGVAVVMLAGPLRQSEPRTKRSLTNIELCVDVSGSMTAAFGDGTRYDGSMRAIEAFLDFRQGDAFGLTFFGNSVLHWVPLTSDASAIRCAPPFMRPEVAPPWMGGTEIGKALLACREVLVARETGDRMIILITDGFSADLGNGNEIEIAHKLAADRIVLYAIHIAETTVPDPIANLTSLTGGAVFHPGDPDALATVFQRIDKMQQTRLEKASAETQDWLWPWCAAGLCLLGAALLAGLGLRYTPW